MGREITLLAWYSDNGEGDNSSSCGTAFCFPGVMIWIILKL